MCGEVCMCVVGVHVCGEVCVCVGGVRCACVW